MGKADSGDVAARARQGDQDAWRELYAAHAGRLLVWLRTLPTGDSGHSAEDVAADAWMIAAQKISAFAGDGDDFAGWLFGIARNLVLNTRRRSIRRATAPYALGGAGDDTMWGATTDPSDAVGGDDLTRRLLAHLPKREAEVVACIDVVGLDVANTALALGMKPTAVRVAHHRGLNRLRALVPTLAAAEELPRPAPVRPAT